MTSSTAIQRRTLEMLQAAITGDVLVPRDHDYDTARDVTYRTVHARVTAQGFPASPGSCRIIAGCRPERTEMGGASEMRVLLSTYGSRGDVEPMVGLAVQVRAQGTEGCDALVASGVTPAGMWR